MGDLAGARADFTAVLAKDKTHVGAQVGLAASASTPAEVSQREKDLVALLHRVAGVRERGTFNVCAHPDALPYSSRDRTTPGFQVEIAEAIAKQLGVGLHVDWIVFTRHARRIDCDASIGSIVKADTDGGGPRRGPRLTKPYVTSGYILVVPPTSPPIERLEEVKGTIAVEHTSWPHYVLERRNLPLSSHGSPFDVLDAVAQGQSAAGLVSDAYTGWYLKLHPGAVKISETYVPERDFRWNVAVGLRGRARRK